MRIFLPVLALVASLVPAIAGQYVSVTPPPDRGLKDYCVLMNKSAESCGFNANYGVAARCETGKALAVSCFISDLSWDMKVNAIMDTGDGGICVWGAPFGWILTGPLPTATASVLCSSETAGTSVKRRRRTSR